MRGRVCMNQVSAVRQVREKYLTSWKGVLLEFMDVDMLCGIS